MKKIKQIVKMWMILVLFFCSGSTTITAQNTVMLKNMTTNRLALSTGEKPTQSENGWLESPKIVGADANYYGRAEWELIQVPKTDLFQIRNTITKRYLLCTGNKLKYKRETEDGWLSSWSLVGADANYYNRANWRITKFNDTGAYLIINDETGRVLLSDGEKPSKSEGGWLKSPKIVSADANYYNRGVWFITGKGASLIGEGSVLGAEPMADKPKETTIKFYNTSIYTVKFTIITYYNENGKASSLDVITVNAGDDEEFVIPGDATLDIKAVADQSLISKTIFDDKNINLGGDNIWCLQVKTNLETLGYSMEKCN